MEIVYSGTHAAGFMEAPSFRQYLGLLLNRFVHGAYPASSGTPSGIARIFRFSRRLEK
ncbi:MAG: hypothetical protein ACREEK_00910 [Bradyrhizobium sp.]